MSVDIVITETDGGCRARLLSLETDIYVSNLTAKNGHLIAALDFRRWPGVESLLTCTQDLSDVRQRWSLAQRLAEKDSMASDAWLEALDKLSSRLAQEIFTVSRPYSNRESVKILAVWEQLEPPPRKWIVPGLLPERALSIWYGDAGVYKSWLATYLATCIAGKRGFLGESVLAGPVVYVDAELDAEEFVRRAYQIARGLGLERPPEGLYYYRLQDTIANPDVVEHIRELAVNVAAHLVILDSLTWAASDVDLKESADTIGLLRRLESWGNILVLDHISKPLPGVNLSNYRPFGSQFKWAGGRCITQVLKAESGKGLVLRPSKTNLGPLAEPIGVEVTFETNNVRFSRVSLTADALAGIGDHLPVKERVYQALAQAGAITPEELAQELGLSVGRVRNLLTALRQERRATSDNAGNWRIFTVSHMYSERETVKMDHCAFAGCDGEVYRYTAEGLGFCEEHWVGMG